MLFAYYYDFQNFSKASLQSSLSFRSKSHSPLYNVLLCVWCFETLSNASESVFWRETIVRRGAPQPNQTSMTLPALASERKENSLPAPQFRQKGWVDEKNGSNWRTAEHFRLEVAEKNWSADFFQPTKTGEIIVLIKKKLQKFALKIQTNYNICNCIWVINFFANSNLFIKYR